MAEGSPVYHMAKERFMEVKKVESLAHKVPGRYAELQDRLDAGDENAREELLMLAKGADRYLANTAIERGVRKAVEGLSERDRKDPDAVVDAIIDATESIENAVRNKMRASGAGEADMAPGYGTVVAIKTAAAAYAELTAREWVEIEEKPREELPEAISEMLRVTQPLRDQDEGEYAPSWDRIFEQKRVEVPKVGVAEAPAEEQESAKAGVEAKERSLEEITKILAEKERKGSLNHEEYESLRGSINSLSRAKDRDDLNLRLTVVADVTGIVDGINPRYEAASDKGKSEGLEQNLERSEIAKLFEHYSGSLEGVQNFLRWMGFDKGKNGDKPIIEDGELGRKLGEFIESFQDVFSEEEYKAAQDLRFWRMSSDKVGLMRKAVMCWVGRGQGMTNEEIGANLDPESELANVASMVESIIKQSRLPLMYLQEDIHPLLGAHKGFGVFQPWRRTGIKTEKSSGGIHRNFIKGKYGEKENFKDAYGRNNPPPRLDGLFVGEMATSHWISSNSINPDSYNPKKGGDPRRRSLKDMVLNGILPRPEDLNKSPMHVQFMINEWGGGAAKIDKYYMEGGALTEVGKPEFAEKFKGEVETILKNMQVFKIEDPVERNTRAAEIVKSILLARIGVQYDPDRNAVDNLRIQMDKDDMYTLITQLNVRRFSFVDDKNQTVTIEIVPESLRRFLLKRSRELRTDASRERYYRMTEEPELSVLYKQWVEHNELGNQEQRDVVAAKIKYIEGVVLANKYNKLTPERRLLESRRRSTQTAVGERLFYSVSLSEKESVLMGKEGADKLKQLDPAEFPPKDGWLKYESPFMVDVRTRFSALVKAEYFPVTDKASLTRGLHEFMEQYLLSRLQLRDGKLWVSDDVANRERYLMEMITALSKAKVGFVIEGKDGAKFTYEGTLINDDLAKQILGLFSFSPEPNKAEARVRMTGSWAEAVTYKATGGEDPKMKANASLYFQETYLDYVRYYTDYSFRTNVQIPFESRISLSSDKGAQIEQIKKPEAISFPLRLGWIGDESEKGFKKHLTDTFQMVARSGYFGEIETQEDLNNALSRFMRPYLLARIGFNEDGKLNITEAHLAELVYALKTIDVKIRYLGSRGVMLENSVKLINTQNNLESELFSPRLFKLSYDPSYEDMRKRRRDDATGRIYREMVVAKAVGDGSKYRSLKDRLKKQEQVLGKRVWSRRGYDDRYSIAV